VAASEREDGERKEKLNAAFEQTAAFWGGPGAATLSRRYSRLPTIEH
jgi:hypothetical protein